MAVLLLVCFSLVLYVAYFYWNVRRYPKGPFPIPFLGNILQLPEDDLHLYVKKLSKIYGPVFTIFTPRALVVLNGYKYVRQALVTEGDHFLGRNEDDILHRIHNGGVIFSDGVNWREQRRLSLQILRTMGMGKNVMEQQVQRCIDQMLVQMSELKDLKHVDMFSPIQICVANVINETLFGYHYNSKTFDKLNYFCQIVKNHFDFLVKNRCVRLFQALPWLKYVPILNYYGHGQVIQNSRQLSAFIEAEILAQQQDYDPLLEPNTFTQAYLQEMAKFRKSNGDGLTQHSYFNIEQLICVCTDFWLAGMETTSTTLRWAINLMVYFPNVQKAMQDEIDHVIGRERLPAMSDRSEMPYCSAAIIELQRRANIVPFLNIHRTTADVKIFEYSIPNDTFTFIDVGDIHRNEANFEDPMEFRPERFLESDGKTQKKDLVEKMVAFGLGKRSCAGEGLARMELFLILVTLLQRFRFEIPADRSPPDLTPIFSSVMFPVDYEVTVVPRL